MSLSQTDKKRFRSIGHNLKPIVTIAGKGLSESVVTELDRALEDHELIKIKLAVGGGEARTAVINAACEKLAAQLVQSLGNTALIFRAAKKPNPKLSNLLRP